MFRLALKSVRHNPLRLILTAIAVTLGVMLVTSTLTLTNALQSGFTSLFNEIYATTDVIVEADPDQAIDDSGDPFAADEGLFTDADVDTIAAIDGVEAAVGGIQVAGSVLAADFDPTAAIPGAGAGGAPSQIFNWADNADIDRATLVEGRGVEADDEIVLDLDSAPRLGYELGDQVMVATETGVTTYELVGLVRFGEDNSLQGATLTYLSTATAKELTGSDTYVQVTVLGTEGTDLDDLATRIGEVVPEGARAITGEAKAQEQTESLGDLITYIDIFTIAFALIALFVGSFIIVNTFRIIVTQRTREFGLMRAIGVKGSQVRSMILLEALIVALIAGTAGVGVGYVTALAMSAIAEAFAGEIFGTIVLPLDAIVASYGLAITITIISALLPAIHASRISPMEALRESATESKKPLTLRNIVGAAMSLLAIASIVIGLTVSVPRPYIWVAAGAAVLIIGVTLLAAQVLVPLAYGLKDFLTRVFGVNGKLAANNIKREPRRSANTAAALMIGVMLLALVATFTESLKSVVTAQFSQTEADFFVLSNGTVPQGAVDVLAEQDGVEAISRLGVTDVVIDDTTYSLGVLDTATAGAAFDFNVEPALDQINGGVFIDPTLAEAGYAVGDTITVEGAEDTLDLVITGEYLNEGDANVWVDWSIGEQLSGEPPIFQALLLLENDDADLDEVQTQFQEALAEDYPLVFLQQPGQLAQLANTVIDLLLGVISALLGAALIVAILGVMNTLLLSVTERTREIGLLRAVGVKRSSVWLMITIESMVMAVFGTILGMILGVSLGAALVGALEEFGFTEVAIPWGWLAVYTVSAAVAGVIAAVWPAWRASRLDILQAIAADG